VKAGFRRATTPPPRNDEKRIMTNATDLATQAPRHAYDDLLDRCRALYPLATSVVFPCEATALAGAVEAARARLITPILVGPRQKIVQIAQEAGLNITGFEIDDVPDARTAAARGRGEGGTDCSLDEGELTYGRADGRRRRGSGRAAHQSTC